MRAKLPRLAAAALLVNHGATQDIGLNEIPNFELDVIFPRNETYFPAEVFPIALAIQNLTAMRTLGDYDFSFDIMPYSDGVTPGGIVYDKGEFELLENGGDGASIFVANSNVTGWIDRKERGERFALHWHVIWPEVREKCGGETTNVFGSIMFAVTAEWDVRKQTLDANGTEPDVKKAPECPALGDIVGIQDRAEGDCPLVVDENTWGQGEPCNVVVDKELAGRIEEKAESMLASAAASTATPEPTDGEDEDGASGIPPPWWTAVAVAGTIGSLALVS